MSSRSRRRSPSRQIERLYRRHRPMIVTLIAGAVGVLGALFIFTRIHAG